MLIIQNNQFRTNNYSVVDPALVSRQPGFRVQNLHSVENHTTLGISPKFNTSNNHYLNYNPVKDKVSVVI